MYNWNNGVGLGRPSSFHLGTNPKLSHFNLERVSLEKIKSSNQWVHLQPPILISDWNNGYNKVTWGRIVPPAMDGTVAVHHLLIHCFLPASVGARRCWRQDGDKSEKCSHFQTRLWWLSIWSKIREPVAIYKLCYAAIRLSWRAATKKEGWSAFRLAKKTIISFGNLTLLAGGAAGWPPIGRPWSSLEDRFGEEQAMELELTHFGTDHYRSSPKDIHWTQKGGWVYRSFRLGSKSKKIIGVLPSKC